MSYPNGPGGYPPSQPGPQGPYPQGGYNYGPPPENHLVWAILTTVLCCLPLGIVSIVKSNQVNTLWAQGFTAEAHKASEEAKKWAMWSAISSGIIWVLVILVYVVLFVWIFKTADTFVDNIDRITPPATP